LPLLLLLLLLDAATAVGPSDVFCLNSTVCFDSYVTYVFAALVLGSKLVVPGPTGHYADLFCYCPPPQAPRPKLQAGYFKAAAVLQGPSLSSGSNALCRCAAALPSLPVGSSDVFCLNSTVCFDSYVTYVFASLVLGAKLVVPGPTAHLDPYGMASLIAAQRISCMEVVPALAAEYLEAFREAGDSISCLKYMLTGVDFRHLFGCCAVAGK
jgi:hypothetical protein